MASALPLATRLTVPPVAADLVPRQRLLDALTRATQHPLALVAAPAGAGKSSLLAAWVRGGSAPGPVAWVSLDGHRLGRSAFWTLVFTAVEHALGAEGAFPMNGPVDAALVSFLNRLDQSATPSWSSSTTSRS